MSKTNQQTKVQYISDENVRNFLKNNNISLEKVGGEKEQREYIARLSKALLTYRKSKGYSKGISREEKAENIANAIAEIGKIFEEAGISNADSDKIIRNFIPFLVPTQENAKALKELRKQIEQIKKQLESRDERIAELEEKLRNWEKKKQSEKNDEEQDNSEIIDEEQDDSKKEIEIIDLDSDRFSISDGKIISIDGEVVEKRDETPREKFKDLRDKAKNLRDQRKELIKSNGKKSKSITEGVADIFDCARNLMNERILVDVNIDNIEMKAALGTALVIGSVITIPGYVAGRLAAKTIKGVAKLGLKAGKAIFKATKGTAKKCKSRADKNRAIRKQKRKYATREALEEAKDVVSSIEDYSIKKRQENSIESILGMEIQDLPDKVKNDLFDVCIDSKRPEVEERLEQENENLLERVNRELRDLRLKETAKKFQEEFGLSEISFGEILNNIALDSNGELIEIGDLPISLDKIKEAGLYDLLKEEVEFPKTNNFSYNEIADILIYTGDPNIDLDKMVKEQEISPEAAKYIKKINKSVENGYISLDDDSGDMVLIESIARKIAYNGAVLKEAYSRDLETMAKELHSQIIFMEQEFEQIKDGNSRKDEKRIKTLRKIAEAKVQSLIDAKIVEVVQGEYSREVNIVEQGRDALDLTEDLEHTIDLKRDKIEQQTKKEQEDTEHDDL